MNYDKCRKFISSGQMLQFTPTCFE